MLVLGDAHADESDHREALLSAYEAAAADCALHVGDLELYDLPVPTWFIAGNNEDFDVVEAMRAGETPEGVSNLSLLASDVVAIEGLRVAGLSGNHAPTRYDRSRDELEGDRRRHFTHEDVEALLDHAGEDIDLLLTHEVPHGLVRKEDYDPGCKHVDRLVRELDPDLCLTGHHHTHVEGSFGDVPVYCLAPVWEAYYELDPEELELTRYEN